MKFKYIFLTVAFVLTIGLGTALAGSGGCGGTKPPPDTASVQLPSPTR